MPQTARPYPLARVVIIAAAMSLVTTAALAQTIAGGLNHTVILKSDGTVDGRRGRLGPARR